MEQQDFTLLQLTYFKFGVEYQKCGLNWSVILEALHEDEFSHRTVGHIMAFYEQVSNLMFPLA